MRSILRFLLLAVAVTLILRYLLAIITPRGSRHRVKGTPRFSRRHISEDRIKDASFKDIPKP